MDGIDHRRLREPLEKYFTKEKLETYRASILFDSEAIIKKWKKNDIIDLSSSFSYLLPVKIISNMLGIKWNDNFPQYAISLQMVKAQPEAHLQHVAYFHQLLQEEILFKKSNPKDDIISELITIGFSNEEILSVSLLLFIAGTGTTASLIIQGLREIIISKMAPHKDLVDNILHKTSPANSAFPRYVHENYQLAGTELHKGDLVLALLASANYDNTNNEDPIKNHLSFSRGIHQCIGWNLAKMEAEIAFNLFYSFFHNSQIISEQWVSNIISRDIVSMQVKLM